MFAGKSIYALVVSVLLGCGVAAAEEAGLRGSKASVARQYNQAIAHDFTFLRNGSHVRRFVRLELLVELTGNKNYTVHRDVRYPYVRPAVKLFVERLSRQYRAACGEKLVVTSATRPLNRQPRNASAKSVHPTGMAVDFRLPSGTCRSWLEDNLLVLEERDVLEATKETSPWHYHVAVYPTQYACYVRARTGQEPCDE